MHAVRKRYEPPTLSKRNWNQATIFLTGHAYLGDRAAWELLALLFPAPTEPNDLKTPVDGCDPVESGSIQKAAGISLVHGRVQCRH